MVECELKVTLNQKIAQFLYFIKFNFPLKLLPDLHILFHIF